MQKKSYTGFIGIFIHVSAHKIWPENCYCAKGFAWESLNAICMTLHCYTGRTLDCATQAVGITLQYRQKIQLCNKISRNHTAIDAVVITQQYTHLLHSALSGLSISPSWIDLCRSAQGCKLEEIKQYVKDTNHPLWFSNMQPFGLQSEVLQWIRMRFLVNSNMLFI